MVHVAISIYLSPLCAEVNKIRREERGMEQVKREEERRRIVGLPASIYHRIE